MRGIREDCGVLSADAIHAVVRRPCQDQGSLPLLSRGKNSCVQIRSKYLLSLKCDH